MGTIVMRNLRKIYPGGVIAVQDFSLEVREGEFLVLVGPSGCGKTTVLRMAAGLEEISSGELWIGGALANRTPPGERDIAMVFQNFALYPHMTVYQNMALPLTLRGMDRREIRRRIYETASILYIDYLLNRKPRALSGGQRQRAALGRAMVRKPAAFLMDEPLSNLDAKQRTQMRTELIRLHRALKTTFLYVTHDQTEAMTMGDRIVVMQNGFVQQIERPQRLYDAPANRFVAGFIGSPQMNFWRSVLGRDAAGFFVRIGAQRVPVAAKDGAFRRLAHWEGRELTVGFRPEAAREERPDALTPPLTGRVTLTERLGFENLLHVDCGGVELVLKLRGAAAPPNGARLTFYLDSARLYLFTGDGENAVYP